MLHYTTYLRFFLQISRLFALASDWVKQKGQNFLEEQIRPVREVAVLNYHSALICHKK